MIIKKTILIVSFSVLLAVGFVVMAISPQNTNNMERKIYYEGKPILEECKILNVDGTTYAPLRALCENTHKEVDWNAAEEKVLIEDEHWYYNGNVPIGDAGGKHANIKMPRQGDAVPDAETASAMGDIILKRLYKDHPLYEVEAENAIFDENYDAWVVYGKLTMKPQIQAHGTKEFPTVVVIRKTDAQVIALS